MPYWGLARLTRIAPVNREMILNFVAQHSLGLPRSYEEHRVPVLTSHVDVRDETYQANQAELALIDQLNAQLELAIAGGGERYQQRHRDRGKLLARERIELLLDPDSPFLELSSLAAWGTEFTVGASAGDRRRCSLRRRVA